MRVRLRSLHCCLLVLLAIVSRSSAQTITWTGSGDGHTWNLASNWSPVRVPMMTDDVAIGAGTPAVTLTSSTSVRSLTVARSLSVGAALTLTNGLVLQANALVTVGCGSIELRGGAQSIAGAGEIASSSCAATLSITQNCAAVIEAGVIVRNAGTAWTVTVDSGCSLTNLGTLRAQGGSTLSVTRTGSFENDGTVEALASSTVNLSGTGPLNSTGMMRANGTSARLNVSGPWSSPTGTLSATTNGSIVLGGTTASLGTIARTSGGTISLSAITFTGTLNATDGLIISASGASTFNGVTVATPLSFANGTLTVTNSLTLLNGTSLNLGCGTLAFSGGAQTLGGTGSIVKVSSGCTSQIDVLAATTLTIAPGITLRTSDNSLVITVAANSSLLNQGTLHGEGGSLTLTRSSAIVNAGTIEALNGTRLTLNGTGTLTNLGTIRCQGTNSLATITGPWSVSGGQIIASSAGRIALGGTFDGSALSTVDRSGGGVVVLDTATVSGTISMPDGLAIDVSTASTLASTFNHVTLATPVTVSSTLTMLNGLTFQNGATLTIQGGILNVNAGAQTLAGTGEIVFGRAPTSFSAEQISVLAGANVVVSSTVTIRILPALSASAHFVVNSGATFNLMGSLLAQNPVSFTISGAFINNGLMSGTGTTYFSCFGNGTWVNNGTLELLDIQYALGPSGMTLSTPGAFTNHGIVRLSGSRSGLNLQGRWSNPDGTIIVSNGALLLLGGTFNFSAVGNLDRVGGNVSFEVATVSGTITSQAGTNFGVSGPDVIFNNATLASPLEINLEPLSGAENGISVIGSLTLTNNARISVHQGFLRFNSGGAATIGGTGEVLLGASSASGSMRVENNTTLTVGSGVVVRSDPSVTGTLRIGSGSTLINRGAIRTTPGRSLFVQNNGVFNNQGAVEAVGPSAGLNFLGAGVIANYDSASATLSGGTWIARANPLLNLPSSTPVQRLEGGASLVFDGQTSEIYPTSSLLRVGNARLSLINHTYATTPTGGTFTNAGTLDLDRGGLLSVSGTFVQSSGGSMAFTAAGETPADYGRVTSTGPSVLAGSIEGRLTGGYVPPLASRFAAVTGSARSDVFSSVLGPPGATPVVEYTPTSALYGFGICIGFITQPQPASRLVGASVTLSVVAAAANGPYSFQWRRNGQPVVNGLGGASSAGGVVVGATTSTIVISNVQVSDAGLFDCTVSAVCGSSASAPALLQVLCPADVDDGSGTGTPDGGITLDDLLYYLSLFLAGDVRADLDDGSDSGTPDGGVTIEDLLYYLGRFNAGC